MNNRLRGFDRIASGVAGVGLITYSLFADLDKQWLQILLIAFGLVFVIGAIGGT